MAWASGTCTDFIDFLRKWTQYAAGEIDPSTDPEIVNGVAVTNVAATNVLTGTGQPSNGDTVTVGGKTYTFQTSLTNVANNVAIGANLADSLSNLSAAINAGAGSGTAYAAATTANANVTATATSTTVTVTAITAGVAGNSIVSTAVSTNLSWAGGVLSGGVTNTWAIQENGSDQPTLPSSGFATDGDVYLIGPGSSGIDQIVVGFETYRNTGAGIYGINSRGYTQFSDTGSFAAMPGVSPETYTALEATSFSCWFWVNGRRMMAAARMGPIDVFMYAGYVIPYSTSAQYPYPLLIGGSVVSNGYDSTQNNYGASCLPDPCENGAYFRWVDGSWNVVEHYDGTGTSYSPFKGTYAFWPLIDLSVTDGAENSTVDNEDALFYSYTTSGTQISASEVGSYPLWPTILHSSTQMIGQLDGVYIVPGSALTPGDTITDSNDNVYDVFHNNYRTEGRDYFAILRA